MQTALMNDAGANSERDGAVKRWGLPLLILGVVIAALWALFTWVISDPEMLLGYVRALAWPVVAAVSLFWLRGPIRDKARDLLKVSGGGFEAQFAAEQLSHQIGPDMDRISGSSRQDDDLDEDASDRGTEDVGEVDANHHNSRQSDSDDEVHATQGASPVGTPQPDASQSPSKIAAERREFLEQATRALEFPARLRERVVNGDIADAEAIILRSIRAARVSARQAQKGLHDNRDALESIIQKSADWGYDMGRSGAPRVIPDVEWLPNGEWRITTEVPKRVESPRLSRPVGKLSSRPRHIEQLVKQIEDIERNDRAARLKGNLGIEDPSDYLATLKRRLAALDPGNPSAM